MKPVQSKKDKLVLDTSLFVNPDVRNDFGDSPTDALNQFLLLAEQAPELDFYMPPSIFSELMNFVDEKNVPGRLFAFLNQKAPSKHEMTCPAIFIYEIVEELRDRVNKGLRIAEKSLRSAGDSTDERQLIQGMRKSYREALREGIIDSKEDVDLILLAKEIDGLLVTADQGAIKWAEKLGVRWLLPGKFKEYVLSFVKD